MLKETPARAINTTVGDPTPTNKPYKKNFLNF